MMITVKLTWLRGEVTVDGVARLLVGEVLHGLKRRRTCGRTTVTYNHHYSIMWFKFKTFKFNI